MLKLHGIAISNFYCIARQVLQEKGLAFDEVQVMANQEPAFLAISPMGKMPVLETEHGFLTETNVIAEYLEDRYPTPALYPQDAFARARVKQLIKITELYVETPAHQLIPWFFGGKPLPDHVREAAQPAMQRGLAALGRLAKFSPWVCGEQYTAADIFLYRSVGMVGMMAQKYYDWDALAEVAGLKDWQARMAQRPTTQAVDQAADVVRKAFFKRADKT